MPLSDREKRMLSLIESGLRADDPKFASRVQRGSVRSRRRRRGGALFVVGLLMLVTGCGSAGHDDRWLSHSQRAGFYGHVRRGDRCGRWFARKFRPRRHRARTEALAASGIWVPLCGLALLIADVAPHRLVYE
jgi:hypothetical protein